MSVCLRTKCLLVWIPLLSLKTSDIAPVSSKQFLDTQATIECRFTLKRVRGMIRTYSQAYISLQVSTSSANLSLPRSSFLIIHKLFARSHLDYGDVIYDQCNNSSLSDKTESVQFNAALAITCAISGTSKENCIRIWGLNL